MKNITKIFLILTLLVHGVEVYAKSDVKSSQNLRNTVFGISDYSEINEYIATNFDTGIYKNFFNAFPNWSDQTSLSDQYIYDQKYQVLDTYAEPEGSPIETGSKYAFFGSNSFINDTESEQTYYTSSFARAVTLTNTTSVLNGWSVAGKGSVGIPTVAGAEITLTYNGSVTNTNTVTETNTYTATPQPVKVQPHQRAETTVSLIINEMQGKFNFYTKLKGNTSVFFNAVDNGFLDQPNNQGYVAQISVFDLIKKESEIHELPENIQLDNNNKLVLLKGQGKYDANASAKFEVKTKTFDLDTDKPIKSTTTMYSI